MSDVKRYDPDIALGGVMFGDAPCMEECAEGDYVKFADYEKLQAENKRLREALEAVHRWFMMKAPEHYNGCGLWTHVVLALKEASGEGE